MTNTTTTYARDLQTKLGLRHLPTAFLDGARAQSFASRCSTPEWVVMADAGIWLVTSPADAEKLVAAGYEYAPF